MAIAAKPGFAAFAVGSAALANLALGRWLTSADSERVYVLGHPINWTCAMQRQFGVPCPTCGITRSVVMSLHGEFTAAWRMAPVGPVAVTGAVLFACGLLALAAAQYRGSQAERGAGWLRRGGLAYAALAVVVWLGGWGLQFHAAVKARPSMVLHNVAAMRHNQ